MKPAGRGFIGDCPGCSYRGALSMSDGEDGRLLLFCHVGCTFQDIAQALGETDLTNPRRRPFEQERQKADAAKESGAFITRLIAESVPASGSVVQVYLESRGIALAPPPDLRCLIRHRHAPSRKVYPVMLGLVRDVAGQVTGLHRTFLTPDGAAKADAEPAKMSLGCLKGGAVRLH